MTGGFTSTYPYILERGAGERIIEEMQDYKYGVPRGTTQPIEEERFPMSMEDAIADLERRWDAAIEAGAEPGGDRKGGDIFNDLGIYSKEDIRKRVEQGWDIAKGPTTDTGIATVAQGGRIGALEGGLLKKVVPRKYSVGERREYYNADPDYGDSALTFPPTWIVPGMISAIMSAGPKKKKKKSVADPKSMRGMGRIKKQEGGLMNLGGMEKDYRQEGGFVPIGGEEKADDVPARLSRNEFVFTADAVRNAGGGDIDAGAEVMENLMNHLEAGGEVSEDSQGLEGAQEMFANTQRLQNRII